MSTNKKRAMRDTILLVVISFIAAHLCFFLLPNVFEPWNAQTVDQLFLLRDRSPHLRPVYDSTIVHVDINNTSIQQLRNFYLNRSQYAQVVRNLAAMGVSVQAYDFIFAARSNEGDDRTLLEAASKAGNVYLGLAFVLTAHTPDQGEQGKNEESLRYLDETSWNVRIEGDPSDLLAGVHPLLTFPALASAAHGLGFLNIRPDRDGIFRRVPLLVRYNGQFYPSLPFRIACDTLKVPPEKITVRTGKDITLHGAHRPGQKPHDIVIPVDRNGNMVVNFIGAWERMKHYNFVDVFHAADDPDELDLWKDEFAGKIVMISDVSTGSSDTGPVPTDINFPLSGLHANVIHTILTEQFMRELSSREMLLVEFAIMAIVLLLSFRFSSLVFPLSTFLVAVSYIGVAALLFFYARVILHLVRPLFLIGFATLLVTAYRYFNEEKEKAVLRQTFEAYFPPSVVKKILANPEMIASVGQKKELTIMFSDIKGFTTYSAALSPHQIQRYLNEYFEAMVEIVFGHQGTVDKYIGDGLMVFFGDPEPQSDHALRCVRAAIAMQKKVRELRDRWQKEGSFPIQVRIGINTGEVIVGNMGSARRLSYTVLGSPVNMAQRLEASAPPEGILISPRTYEFVKDQIPVRSVGQIQLKGIDAPVEVYEVVVETQPAGAPQSVSPVMT